MYLALTETNQTWYTDEEVNLIKFGELLLPFRAECCKFASSTEESKN